MLASIPNTEYAILDQGRVKVLQALECTTCKSTGNGYVDMSFVVNGRIRFEVCPNCNNMTIEISTYREVG